MSYSLLHTAYVAAASRERLEGHDGRPRPQPPPGRVRVLVAGVLAQAAGRLDGHAAREALGTQRPEPAATVPLSWPAESADALSCEGRRLSVRQLAGDGGRQGRRR